MLGVLRLLLSLLIISVPESGRFHRRTTVVDDISVCIVSPV